MLDATYYSMRLHQTERIIHAPASGRTGFSHVWFIRTMPFLGARSNDITLKMGTNVLVHLPLRELTQTDLTLRDSTLTDLTLRDSTQTDLTLTVLTGRYPS